MLVPFRVVMFVCVLEVSTNILPLSTSFLLEFGFVLVKWYAFLFQILNLLQCV